MRKVKINHNYFAITDRVSLIKSFCRQGNVLAHLWDRVKWHWFPRLKIVPTFPTHLDIEVSSACNLRCPMCKSTHMREAGKKFGVNMDFDLYKLLINECADNSVYSVKLSWRGEPLMHPQIVDMVSYAKKRGIKDVAFLTNGALLTEDLASKLVRSELDWISLSFDGFKDDYERIRYPAKFDEVIETFRYMRECREYFNRKKPQIRVQSIQSVIEGREKEFEDLWAGIADKVYYIPDQVRTLDEGDYKHDPQFICPNPWQRMVVAANGLVHQCITDYCGDVVLGDTYTQTLKEIWHSPHFYLQRERQKRGLRLVNKPCRICGTGAVMKDGKYV